LMLLALLSLSNELHASLVSLANMLPAGAD